MPVLLCDTQKVARNLLILKCRYYLRSLAISRFETQIMKALWCTQKLRTRDVRGLITRQKWRVMLVVLAALEMMVDCHDDGCSFITY